MYPIRTIILAIILTLPALTLLSGCHKSEAEPIAPAPAVTFETSRRDPWRRVGYANRSKLLATGANDYFSLIPGTISIFQDGATTLTITVLTDTRIIDAVTTRVVEEREERQGLPVEVSRNYYAIDKISGDVFYFGEEVDIYKAGKVAGHDGSWLAGVEGARFGLAMPAHPVVGDRYYQEQAPGIAMDRAEILSLDAFVNTSEGDYEHCVQVRETSPLDPEDISYKWYVKGVGLVKDGGAALLSHVKGVRH